MTTLLPRYWQARGLRIPLWGNRQIELWYAPRGMVIPLHSHTHCDSRIVFLGGRMTWFSATKKALFGWRDIGKSLVALAGELHGAHVSGAFGLFANFQNWVGKPTSAAHDFVAAPAHGGTHVGSSHGGQC